MTTQPRPGHREVIEDALTDWWTLTDPAEPFHTPAVAEQVETYLLTSGYTISPNTRRNPPVPSRTEIAVVLVLAVACVIAVVLAVIRHDWEWVALGTVGTGLLGYETIRDLRDRRQGRGAR